jgi:uncharacterized protein (UPF0332 family)
MIKSNFLTKLKNENALKLVESSDEISKSYLIKSEKCIKVAELAYNAEIYENAVSEAYYSIYNSVLSLFFKCGIKCENHSAAVILIEELFNLNELYPIFSEFKKDRIDNQYYIPIVGTESITKEDCASKIKIAKEFNVKIRAYADNLKLQEINIIRERFNDI